MSRAARPVGLLLAVALAAALLVAGVAVGRPGKPDRSEGLSVRGSVRGLYPGQQTSVPVTVRNRSARTVRITLVTGRLLEMPTRRCPTSVLRLGTARPDRVVRPGRTAVVDLPVELDRAAPDACQGVTFPLSLRAVAGAD